MIAEETNEARCSRRKIEKRKEIYLYLNMKSIEERKTCARNDSFSRYCQLLGASVIAEFLSRCEENDILTNDDVRIGGRAGSVGESFPDRPSVLGWRSEILATASFRL